MARQVQGECPSCGTRIVIRLGDQLTEREDEVLHLVALGLSNKAIAERLGISSRTVEGHLVNVAVKYGTHTRDAAVTEFYQRHRETGRGR